MIRVWPLAARPKAHAALARIMTDAWPDWYGPGGSGDVSADLARRATPGLPQGWLAMVGNAPVGTVGLSDSSFGAETGEGPWLVGLVTDPAFRRRGIGDALIATVEEACQGPLYTTAREARRLFKRRGWQELREAGEGWTVLRLRKV